MTKFGLKWVKTLTRYARKYQRTIPRPVQGPFVSIFPGKLQIISLLLPSGNDVIF